MWGIRLGSDVWSSGVCEKADPRIRSCSGSSSSIPQKKHHRRLIRASAAASGAGDSSAVKRKRRLILLRHAHSSWSNPSLRDHERPLSGLGRQQAASIGYKLWESGWVPEVILCSDSTRTQETLSIMQKHCTGLASAEVHLLASFYSVAAMDGHTAQHLQEAVCKYCKDEVHTVLCMGHNKGWEEAAGVFCGKPVDLKTANATLLEASGRSWQEAFALAGAGGWKLKQILQPAEVAESARLDIDYLT